MTETERSFRLTRRPGVVEDVCRFVDLATTDCEPSCREAAALAATELSENLLKYAADASVDEVGTFEIRVQGNRLVVRTTNRVVDTADAESVIELVRKIEVTPGGAKHLYRERLRELFQQPALPRAQLGLLRLVYEGGVHLSARLHGAVLEVVATRAALGAE